MAVKRLSTLNGSIKFNLLFLSLDIFCRSFVACGYKVWDLRRKIYSNRVILLVEFLSRFQSYVPSFSDTPSKRQVKKNLNLVQEKSWSKVGRNEKGEATAPSLCGEINRSWDHTQQRKYGKVNVICCILFCSFYKYIHIYLFMHDVMK